MAIDIRHLFVSAKADSLDTSRVQPSNWNAALVFKTAAAVVVGRGAGAGQAAVTEIPMGATGQALLATANQAAAQAVLGNQTEATIAAAATKTPPVDADSVAIIDVAGGNVLKRVTWLNIKNTLQTFFNALYSDIAHTHTFAAITAKPTTLAGYGITDGGSKTRKLVYAASTSYAKPAGLVAVDVTVHGASGGGGGAISTNTDTGSGGGGATIARRLIAAASLGASETITIGAAGAGGAAGNNDGTDGGSTSFGALVVITGGTGGGASGSAPGVAGIVTSASYDRQWVGGPGLFGINNGSGSGNGAGGQGAMNSATPVGALNATGRTADTRSGNAGCGGRGGAGTSRAGGAGCPGWIEVVEYYN